MLTWPLPQSSISWTVPINPIGVHILASTMSNLVQKGDKRFHIIRLNSSNTPLSIITCLGVSGDLVTIEVGNDELTDVLECMYCYSL